MITQPYNEMDGIKVFHASADEHHPDYHAQGLNNLFLEEEKHFWFLIRKQFIAQQLQGKVSLDASLIEIGAGTGNVARYLKSSGYRDIAVGEMHMNGLYYAKSYGITKCYQFDLLNTPFKKEFDAVCMFDVLEHIEDDLKALSNANQMLRNGGKIILTVPAHQWLWNCDDEISGHKRRYSKDSLTSKLKESGFDIEVSRYFFMSIVPLLFLRKVRNKAKREVQIMEEGNSGIAVPTILNKLLYFMLKVENMLNSFLPNMFGGSLIIIAKKHDTI